MNTTPTRMTVRVAARVRETDEVCSLDLVAADPAVPLPPFSAGAHIDLHLPGGLVRQYSLMGDPAEHERYRIAVLREPAGRGGSQAVHALLHPGATLEISVPRNAFALHASAGFHLLLAGGIGLTPLLAMAHELHAKRQAFSLHVCTRSRDRLPMAADLQAAEWSGRVHLHFDDTPDTVLALDAELAAALPDAHVYVCGPSGFIDWARCRARAAGWDEVRIHSESFQPAVPGGSADGAFTLELASSGRRIHVPADQTALQALRAAGVPVASSCEQGVCGSCQVRVASGVPDHRDLYLTPQEQAANACFLPCCSRAKTDTLVLGL